MELGLALGRVGHEIAGQQCDRQLAGPVRHRIPLAAACFGGATVLGYYGLAWVYWLVRRASGRLADFGKLRYAVTAFLFMTMLSLPIKMALRLVLSVKYVWVTPWFNI